MRKDLLETQKAIISILVYFDLFDYPLIFNEISRFLPIKRTDSELEEGIINLLFGKKIFLIQDFYLLRDDKGLVDRRIKGNRKAMEMMKKAERIGEFLSQVPFIKGLGISGSLSKNYADHTSDIDHFLIIKRNRLWLARGILFFLRKIAIMLGRKDDFCLNYFIDEDGLQIKDKNIYTAMELITLANPMGNEVYENFLESNTWAMDFFPNYPYTSIKAKKIKENHLKRTIEKFLDNRFGDYLNMLCMRLNTYLWDRDKQLGKRDSKNQVRVVVFDQHCTKLNPMNFQEVFLVNYEKKLSELFEKIDFPITSSSGPIAGSSFGIHKKVS